MQSSENMNKWFILFTPLCNIISISCFQKRRLCLWKALHFESFAAVASSHSQFYASFSSCWFDYLWVVCYVRQKTLDHQPYSTSFYLWNLVEWQIAFWFRGAVPIFSLAVSYSPGLSFLASPSPEPLVIFFLVTQDRCDYSYFSISEEKYRHQKFPRVAALGLCFLFSSVVNSIEFFAAEDFFSLANEKILL